MFPKTSPFGNIKEKHKNLRKHIKKPIFLPKSVTETIDTLLVTVYNKDS